jgi:transcription termination/antitermination protein NusA
VRLASKLVDWDIEIMTHDELNTTIEKAEMQFSALPEAQPDLVDALIEEGFLSYEDIAVLTPAELCEMGGMDEDTAAEMIAFADEEAQEMERAGKFKPRDQVAVPSHAPAPVPRPVVEPATTDPRKKFENLFSNTEPAVPADAQPEATPEESAHQEEQAKQADVAQAEQDAVQAFLQATTTTEVAEKEPVPTREQALPPHQGEPATPEA